MIVNKMVGVFRPDEGKIGRMASRKRGASKTTQSAQWTILCMAEERERLPE